MAGKSDVPEPPRRVTVQGLAPHDGDDLSPGEDRDGVAFDDLQLSGLMAPNARFTECAFSRCSLADCELAGSSLRVVEFDGVRAVSVDLSATYWVDVTVAGSALAGVESHGASLRRVAFRDCKLDAVNFRTATLLDVDFERCVLSDVDFGGATLRKVRFQGCRLTGADFSKATLERVDLRGSELGIERGYESLAGAVIDSTQLVALAPDLANHLGIAVRDSD